MLTEKELYKIAVDELIRIFGERYLRETYKTSCTAYGMVDDETYMVFTGINGSKDIPNRRANDHGWVVYGEIRVDAATGKIKKREYVLE